MIRDYPLVPLIVLLIGLMVLLHIIQPGILNQRWAENLIRFAIPLAMLAACQTLTMLTGGIDLSAGTAATVSAFVVATQTPIWGPWVALLIALVPAINGIGIGITRVHPLIMTLGTGLIAAGCLQVYQRTVIASGSEVPEFLGWLGTGKTWIIPNVVFLFVPLAAAIIFMLRRTGFGRLLYALGENENAARLSGVRSWQVYLSLYTLSGLLAGITGLVYVSLSLVEPRLLPAVAAAVIGGTSIFGGRGTYSGTIVGALILTVLTTMLTVLQMPEGTRRILFGAIILGVTAIYIRITEDS
ncbi:MAG: ABC transporter permease [Rhodobacteraceae bacterium]|nr:ABC transporter permease [Paracoccaceae bacterium]